MTQINIKKKTKFGRPTHILQSNDLLAIQSFARQHYVKREGWTIIKQPELTGLFRKHYRMELMK